MSAATRNAARGCASPSLRPTASTRASRSTARSTKCDEGSGKDDVDLENVRCDEQNPRRVGKSKTTSTTTKLTNVKASSAKASSVKTSSAKASSTMAASCDENASAVKLPPSHSSTKSVGGLPASAIPTSVSTAFMRPPLSPSKSAGNVVRLPLSPSKRHHGNPPANSGLSPPKMMKNDENASTSSPRKTLASPIRGPPQSPLGRRVQSPCGQKTEFPSLTARSLFSARSKSASTASTTFSKPLRTSCHPPSPLKSPPTFHLASAFPRTLTASPTKTPLTIKRNDLFGNSELNNNSIVKHDVVATAAITAATAATAARPSSLQSPPASAKSASTGVLSPRTPLTSVESKSPGKPSATSPGKPPPSPTRPSPPPSAPSVRPAPTPPSAPSPATPPAVPTPAALGSPTTSPAESRLARLNLNVAPSPYAAARKAFNTAAPAGEVKGREAEKKEIVEFIEDNIANGKSGALYVSGAPGTGKTATLNTIINEYKTSTKCVTIYINCMSIRNSSLIYAKILTEGSPTTSSKGGAKGAQKGVEKLVTGKGKPMLLFLDEMDQLGDTNNQDVLYTLFEWTFIPQSRLILVGVANALDLTERILPRLQAKAQRKPRTMNFAPYSQIQLMDILSHRLSTSSPAPSTASTSSPAPPSLVDKSALLFCAKKIAAVSGDARKALDACRYAIEMVEKSSAESTPNSTPFSTPISTPTSGSTPASQPKKVGITHVMRVLSGVYENAAVATSTPTTPNNASGSGGGTLTLQQKIIICCLVLIHKKVKSSKVVTIGKLQDVYKKVCQRKGFLPGMSEAGGSDQAEFLSILSNIEASGILTVKKEKVSRDSKVTLLLDEKELEKSLQDDRKMLATILLQSDIL